MAFGIIGSETSGLRENFGSMIKPFHAGQSNAKAVLAALLAKNGFSSSKTIFKDRFGFFKVMCKDVKTDELTESLGRPFCLDEIKLKLYPACGGTQCSIDATLNLVKEFDFKPEDIEDVTVKCE